MTEQALPANAPLGQQPQQPISHAAQSLPDVVAPSVRSANVSLEEQCIHWLNEGINLAAKCGEVGVTMLGAAALSTAAHGGAMVATRNPKVAAVAAVAAGAAGSLVSPLVQGVVRSAGERTIRTVLQVRDIPAPERPPSPQNPFLGDGVSPDPLSMPAERGTSVSEANPGRDAGEPGVGSSARAADRPQSTEGAESSEPDSSFDQFMAASALEDPYIHTDLLVFLGGNITTLLLIGLVYPLFKPALQKWAKSVRPSSNLFADFLLHCSEAPVLNHNAGFRICCCLLLFLIFVLLK